MDGTIQDAAYKIRVEPNNETRDATAELSGKPAGRSVNVLKSLSLVKGGSGGGGERS